MKITIRFTNGFVENAETARVIAHIGDEPHIQPALAKWGGPKEKWSMFPMQWIPVPVEGVNSFGHLHANEGVLWSFGTNQLASTTDGIKWELIPGLI